MRFLFAIGAGVFFVALARPCVCGDAPPIPGAKPVSANQLDGVRLILPGGKHSISAPAADWKWFELPATASGNHGYVCHHAESGADFAVVASKTPGEINGKTVEGILRGIRRGAAVQKATVSKEKHAPSDFPAPGSHRLSYLMTIADGTAIVRQEYYVRAGDLLLSITCATLDEDEPETFKQLVGSLMPAK